MIWSLRYKKGSNFVQKYPSKKRRQWYKKSEKLFQKFPGELRLSAEIYFPLDNKNQIIQTNSKHRENLNPNQIPKFKRLKCSRENEHLRITGKIGKVQMK